MKERYGCSRRSGHGRHGHRGGSSSYWMHDPEVVFGELALKEGDRFLDMGCGPGDYALRGARIVGNSGAVYALDTRQSMVDGLREKADSQGLKNIRAIVSDITGPLPIEDRCIDACLLSTVLHIFNLPEIERTIFNEIGRVLKPGGRVAVIECKKEKQPFGPPMHMRLSPGDIRESIQKFGFKKLNFCDLGYNYMIQFLEGGSISPGVPNGGGKP